MLDVGIWVVGDQVYRKASSFEGAGRGTPVVFIESREFCRRRPYHWQKLVLIFSAMRHFAAELEGRGFDVHYFRLAASIDAALAEFVNRTGIKTLRVMEPNDYGCAEHARSLGAKLGCRVEVTPNNQFLISHDDFDQWAEGKKSLVMEFFYRMMRRRFGALVDANGEPLGGQWNLDKLNRQGRIPAGKAAPTPAAFTPDAITREVIADVQTHFADVCFGLPSQDRATDFIWPVTPAQASEVFERFIADRLADFGPFEDAMSERSWSLWHSHMAPAMNCGLIHPQYMLTRLLEVALPLVQAGQVPLQSVEGFVRQIIGWREFMRGMYWREMTREPQTPYPMRNALGAMHPLPAFYWTGRTEMRCVEQSLASVLRFGFSHHITRLMVLSNFALLHGISPQMVNEWFIYAYADGYEWVTTPNVIGMSLYADGGLVATKPYAAGGAYINKMSDHCGQCRFDPKVASGADACPFTRAYWPFVARHKKMLAANPRTTLMAKGLDRFSGAEIDRRSAETRDFLLSLPIYQPGSPSA